MQIAKKQHRQLATKNQRIIHKRKNARMRKRQKLYFYVENFSITYRIGIARANSKCSKKQRMNATQLSTNLIFSLLLPRWILDKA